MIQNIQFKTIYVIFLKSLYTIAKNKGISLKYTVYSSTLNTGILPKCKDSGISG